MSVSFKSEVEAAIAKAMGLKKHQLYDVPNMDKLVEMTNLTLTMLHETYQKTRKNTLDTARVMGLQCKQQGHALDDLFVDALAKVKSGQFLSNVTDLGDADTEKEM